MGLYRTNLLFLRLLQQSKLHSLYLGVLTPNPHPCIIGRQGPIAAKCRRPELHLALSEDLAQNAAPWYRGDSVVENATQARSVLHAIADAERAMLWSMVRLALTGSVTEEELFQSECSPNDHQSFTLRPMARSTVPLQWIHIGPWAIPDILADTSCSRMGVGELLHHLNSVLGTTYTMGVSGLQNCLRHVLNTSHDFGQAYGTLRTWWFDYDFTKVLRLMDTRREADEHLSSSAIQGCCITDSHIPPRRVWDLFSNRVLPFYSMPPGLHPHDIPDILCTVSHSWVSEWERKDVWTQINGEQWPVPIPRAISLEQIRVELLNMEAEYVWLDVLCLRRCGGCDKDNEEARREEWTLDVPTIGYTFSSHERRCITYFNGLGLPLDTSPSLLASERHWFSRVWILQESVASWLPGGLTGQPLVEAPRVLCAPRQTRGRRVFSEVAGRSHSSTQKAMLHRGAR